MPNTYLDPYQPKRHLDQKRLLSIQYFLYFGIMGAFLPYFNLYCHKIGFSGIQIGNLSAARQVAMIIFPLIWASLADRFNSRRQIFIGCSVISAVLWGGLLTTTDFGWMLIILTSYGIFYAPLIPFLEAFSMDILKGRKKSYGRMRLWGSIAFISMVLMLGWLIDRFSIRIILGVIWSGSLLQALFAVAIPNTQPVYTVPFRVGIRHLFHQRFVIFMLCAFLMLLSHGAYYGFFSIHLNRLGFSTAFISTCWAIASTAEIGVMVFSARIFKLFSLNRVLMFSFLMAAVRWIGLSSLENAGAILLTQLTHAITYGTFHMASILYVDKWVPREVKTLGQAINNALTYGLGLMVGFYLSGNLFERFGTPLLFEFSGLLAFCGGFIFFWYDRRCRKLRYRETSNLRGEEKKEPGAS